jgi:hypothetical protein
VQSLVETNLRDRQPLATMAQHYRRGSGKGSSLPPRTS